MRVLLLGVLLLGANALGDVAVRELFCPIGLVDTLVSKAIAGEEIDAVPLRDSCEYREAASVGFLQVDAQGSLPSAQEQAKETCVTCDSSSGCDQGSFYKLIEPLSEGKTQDIDCGKSFSVKEVTTASFGWPMGTATNFVKHPDMDDPGAKGMIEMDCKGKQSCTIHSVASEGWDPKPGSGRWLTAKIRCAKAKPAPNPVCCPAGMYIQPGAARPKDTICVGHNATLDTPCAMFNAAEVRPCKVPTIKTCFKTCANVDHVSDGSEAGQSLGLGNLMCSKVCIKVMAMAQKHKIDNLEMVDWPAKAVHLDAVKTGDAARQSAFDKEAAEKNCAMKPGDTIKTCCEDGMTLSPGEAGGAPMCTGGGKPECVLWSTSGRRRRRLLFLGAPPPGPSICNSQEPASGPVPKPLAANSQRWTDKTTCTAAVTWKDESLKKLSPAEQAVAEASPAYKKPVFQTYVTGINPGTRVKFSGCHNEAERVAGVVKPPLFWANRNDKCDGPHACQGIKGKCDWCGYHGKCCKKGEGSDDGACASADGCVGQACCVSHDPKLDLPPKPVSVPACNRAGELSKSIVDFKTGEVIAAGPCCSDTKAEIISLIFDTSQCATPASGAACKVPMTKLQCIGPVEKMDALDGHGAVGAPQFACPKMGLNAETEAEQIKTCEAYGNTEYRCMFKASPAPEILHGISIPLQKNNCVMAKMSTPQIGEYVFANGGKDGGRKPEFLVTAAAAAVFEAKVAAVAAAKAKAEAAAHPNRPCETCCDCDTEGLHTNDNKKLPFEENFVGVPVCLDSGHGIRGDCQAEKTKTGCDSKELVFGGGRFCAWTPKARR